MRIVFAILAVSLPISSLWAEENPLFAQLRREGVSVDAKTKAPLPAPIMADGLDAAAQRKVLAKVVGNRFALTEFTGKSGTAPHIIRKGKIAEASSEARRVYGVDLCFIAHGSLDRVAEKRFLEDLHKKQKDRKIHVLTPEEIEKRKLSAESNERRQELYSYGIFFILERVELNAALHTIITRQGDSLLAATQIETRLDKDADFPNRWRKITLDEEGRRKLGLFQPYAGAGGYLKITRLHEPKGALFVEYHLVYTEPKGWFNGADPLFPKLPAIIKSEVGTFRHELHRNRDRPNLDR